MNDLVARLRKQATCVYLATEAGPAADLSDGLTKAADEIERLRSRHERDVATMADQIERLLAGREELKKYISSLEQHTFGENDQYAFGVNDTVRLILNRADEQMVMEYQGYCVGGPADGRFLSASTKKLFVPVKTGPDRGEGDRGFGCAEYQFADGKWLYSEH